MNLELQAKRIDASELARRQQEIFDRQRQVGQQANRESLEQIERTARFVNMVLPPGWLPLGVMTAAEGSALPSLLGLLGMTVIGSVSLFRAYRTTIGMYQGVATSRKGRPGRPGKQRQRHQAVSRGRACSSARLPGLSEPVSAVALAGFRSLLRTRGQDDAAFPHHHVRHLRQHALADTQRDR